MEKLFGGIEAGGTKFVCAIGTGPDDIRDEIRFQTTNPTDTIGKAIEFFREYQTVEPLNSIGIASFGPVNLDKDSPSYGSITNTPKPNWSNIPFAKIVSDKLGLPVFFDTDVNGALLGEFMWGAAKGYDNVVYLTIGTGIGGGAIVNGQLVHGLVHPEMGHILLTTRNDDPMPEGLCPFHGACLEGMAAGPAIEKRWKIPGSKLSPDHIAWEFESYYLAQALHSIICMLSPERIILGGGVMSQTHLFYMVRKKTLESLNNYVQHQRLLDMTANYIVPPTLGSRAGVLGAIALAQNFPV